MIKLDKDTKILVTGATGFIGKHLTEKLTLLKCTVDSISKENGDIRDTKLNLDNYDVIYHLAGISNPTFCDLDSIKAWDVNVNGTMNILRKLKEDQKLVFASSAHVYGNKNTPHMDDESLKPKDFYGLTKRVCEDLLLYYSKKVGYRFTICRFFNIYGEGQKKGFILPDVIGKYKSNKKVEINNPRTVRDFLHIKDAINALVKAADVDGTFNVSYGTGTKIEDIYKIVKNEIRWEHGEEIVVDNGKDVLIGDISKAKYEMGWNPKISLEKGIREVIKFYMMHGK